MLHNTKLTTAQYSNTNHISVLPPSFNFVTTTKISSPFTPSNVVMFTDTLCGSSCASFHEELKNIAGVRAVTVGGRPQNGPIQTVTGSKGGEVIPLIYFPQYASNLINISSTLNLKSVARGDKTLSPLANVRHLALRAGDSDSRIQSQDQIRKGDATGTPLQFIYEAADCRIFYTPTTFADPDAAWKQAFDAWQDSGKCVEGSTGHNSSLSGGFKPFGKAQVGKQDQPEEPKSGTAGSPSSAHSVRSGGWMGVGAAAAVAVVVAAVM